MVFVVLALKFVSYTFHRLDSIRAQLFANFPDVYINGAVPDDYVVPPYLGKNLVTGKNFIRF